MLDDGPTLPLDHTLSAVKSHVLDFLLSKKLAPNLRVLQPFNPFRDESPYSSFYPYREGDSRFTQKGGTAYLEPIEIHCRNYRGVGQKNDRGGVPIGAENNQTDVEKPRRDIDKTGRQFQQIQNIAI